MLLNEISKFIATSHGQLPYPKNAIVEVKRTLRGLGIFALIDIATRDPILEFKGTKYRARDLPFPCPVDCFLQIDFDVFLGPSGAPDDFCNHSCDPNAGIKNLVLTAIKPISKGHEITFDYSTMTFDNISAFSCKCGSVNCRSNITSFMDLHGNVQTKYVNQGIVAPYLVKYLTEIEG